MVTIYEELRSLNESNEAISPLEYVVLNCAR